MSLYSFTGIMEPEKIKRYNAAISKEIYRQRIFNSGYSEHGANMTKTQNRGFRGISRSPDEDINDNLSILRERSRDIYMGGACLGNGVIKTIRTNVVGCGLSVKPNIDYQYLGMNPDEARKWQENVKREFNYWAESINCDAQRINNFYELQQLAMISALMNGDCFAVMPYIKRKNCIYQTTIRLIEGDRIDTPSNCSYDRDIHRGVKVDKNGEIISYFIFDRHPGSKWFNPNEYTEVSAFGKKSGERNVIHVMDSERIAQTRGVPILAPVIETLKRMGQYTEAELQAALVGGLFTTFIKTEDASGIGEFSVPEIYDKDNDEIALGPGAVVNLAKGESIETANPGRPNANFSGFIEALSKQVGSTIEVSDEILMKKFSSSYSASRAAMLEAWKMFRMRRSWFANDFCQPIYERWMCEAVSLGRLYAPGFWSDPIARRAYCKADWNGPSQGQIDPIKEVEAAVKRIENGLSTREREAMEINGSNFYENIDQLARETETMREKGLIPTEL